MKNTPNPIKMKSFTCAYFKSNTIVPGPSDRHLTYNGGKKPYHRFFFPLIKILQTFFYTWLFAVPMQSKVPPKKRGTMAQLAHKRQFLYGFLIPG